MVKDEKQAKDLIYLIGVGEDMGKIAREKSLDKATAKNGGELPFTNVNNFAIPNLGSVSLLLKKGELYGNLFRANGDITLSDWKISAMCRFLRRKA